MLEISAEIGGESYREDLCVMQKFLSETQTEPFVLCSVAYQKLKYEIVELSQYS